MKDSLTLRCDLVVFNEINAAAEAAAPTTFLTPSDLVRHLGDLLQTGKGTDLVLQVGTNTFPVHRWLLVAQSPVFSAEFFGCQCASNTGGRTIPPYPTVMLSS